MNLKKMEMLKKYYKKWFLYGQSRHALDGRVSHFIRGDSGDAHGFKKA